MQDLLQQLQQLAPLAAAATPGHWYGENDEDDDCWLLANHDGHVAEIANMSWVMSDGSQADVAFIAAARNVLTPENLTLLVAALAAPKDALECMDNGDYQSAENVLRAALKLVGHV